MDLVTRGRIDWGVASAALEPPASGDAHLVLPLGDCVLLALVDGLGHGPQAAAAAKAAVALLAAAPPDPVEALTRCHVGLRGTRGVVLTGVWIDVSRDLVTWLAVGDIQGALVHRNAAGGVHRHAILGGAGIVGRALPGLRPKSAPIARGDLVLLATDGIHRDFDTQQAWSDTPQRLADDSLVRYRTGVDDATVLVARYQEAAS